MCGSEVRDAGPVSEDAPNVEVSQCFEGRRLVRYRRVEIDAIDANELEMMTTSMTTRTTSRELNFES